MILDNYSSRPHRIDCRRDIVLVAVGAVGVGALADRPRSHSYKLLLSVGSESAV